MRAPTISAALAACLLVLGVGACDRSGGGGGAAGTSRGAAAGEKAGVEQGDRRYREHGEEGEGGAGAAPAEKALGERVSLGAEAPEGIEEASAADILADPARFQGKNVRVAGTVKGYCHHARAWFAIDVPGASPPYLRLLTAPAFAVPEGCMGARVTAHGTVELMELPRQRVEHFESEHRLGTAADAGSGDQVVRPVIRTAGAVFEPAP